MPDFYVRRDLQLVTAFTQAAALVDFDCELPQQTVRNRGPATVEVSFDGINVHAVIDADGSFGCVTAWDHHKRKRLWLRAVAPAAPNPVDVLAASE